MLALTHEHRAFPVNRDGEHLGFVGEGQACIPEAWVSTLSGMGGGGPL